MSAVLRWVPLALILLLLAIGPALTPYSPTAFDPAAVLQPPSLAHWCGTDEFGRDLFSRLIDGARPTLLVAILGALIGVGLGAVTGLVAAYLGSLVDEAIMRAMDVLMSFPGLILAMLLMVVLGPQAGDVIAALVVVFWPRSTRLCRAVALEVNRRDFIQAARSRGEDTSYILFREILPNIRSVLVVDLGLRVTSGIQLAAALAYLGIGFAPPSSAWGLLIHDGQPFLLIAPWLVLFPCLPVAIVSVVAVAAARRLQRLLPGARIPE